MTKKIKQHYHWLVMGLVLLEMTVYGGIMNSFSIFIIPLCESLGASRGEHSLAIMPYTLMCFVSTMFSGFMLKHMGYRKGTAVSLLLAAGGTVMMAFADSLYVLAIGRVVFALGYGMCFTAGAVMIVKNWFWKHQGLMIGLVSMGTGIGGSVMTVLLTAVMERWDWRVAFLVKAGILILVSVSYFLLMRNRPGELGLKAYGFGEKPKTAKMSGKDDGRDWAGYSLKEQMGRKSFYVMCFCLFTSSACVYMTSSVVVPHFRDLHFSAAEAAGYQSVMMLAVGAAKLLSGGMSDRFGAKRVTVGCMVCAIFGQAFLSFVTDPVLNYIGIVIFAAGMCMTTSMIPLLATSLFGYRGSMSSNGIFLSVAAISALFASLISNFGYDALGSYIPVFRVAACVNLGILLLFFLLFAMAKKDKKRFLAQEA